MASTNHLDQLDPGLSSRPSRFDRKYLFPFPSEIERVLYCNYWREKLKAKPSIKFPKKLCIAIAGITQEFSFAYLKEAFVATLLTIARRRTEGIYGGGDDEDDDLDDYELWVEMKKTVKALREDMGTRNKRTAFGHMLEAATPEPMGFLPPAPLVQQVVAGSSTLPIHHDVPVRGRVERQTTVSFGHQHNGFTMADHPWSALPLMTDNGEVLDPSTDRSGFMNGQA